MKRAVPGLIMTVAILHFVGGGLGLMCDACGILSGAVNASGAFQPQGNNKAAEQLRHQQEMMEQAIEKRVPHYKVIAMIEAGTGLVIDVMMILAGIGLLQLQSWGRKLSIVYACVSIPCRLLFLVVAILTAIGTSEAMEVMAQQDPNMAGMSSAMKMGALGGGIFVLIFRFLFLLYPLFVLYVMFRRDTVQAISGKRLRRASDDDEADEDEAEKGDWRQEADDDTDDPDEHVRPDRPRR